MDKQLAVVTGASSGFGLLTSLELARKGFYVIATMRDIKKQFMLINEAERYGIRDYIEVFPLDVTLKDSIDQWRDFIIAKGRIDVLVNNAGFAGAGFAEEISVEEYRQQFETNFFGVIGVTQVVLPLMRQQGRGKIINMSSISGRVGFPGLSPYVSSKYALEGWSESLRLELKPYGIDVVLIEPGSYQTNIWTSGKKITEKSLTKESPYNKVMTKLEQHIESGSTTFGDPADVAKLAASIAIKDKTSFRYPIGKGVKSSILLKTILPWAWLEKFILNKLMK
ncbi:short-chain dehydrogenase [Bacillus sp. UMB0899]|uniref:oxidoreductase n=1 Tax=Metabacillus schmidteae TaxID=2730405 RepID=UPI000C8076EE|nr:oxidoreductase [Metabacillus schmidteae]PMC35555.1 short-chain dehydrogenase [Bacillus sp. UMB0899]